MCFTFVSTSVIGTHKMSGGERYMKTLPEPEWWKNVSWISLSFTCKTRASHNLLSYSWVTNVLISSTWCSSSCKGTERVLLNKCASENTFVWTYPFEAGMTLFFEYTEVFKLFPASLRTFIVPMEVGRFASWRRGVKGALMFSFPSPHSRPLSLFILSSQP